MPGPGGKTTFSGTNFQAEITTLFLGRLVDYRVRGDNEMVVEVRPEAGDEAEVDDIVVRFKDGHTEWIQVKENLETSGDAWVKMWHHFEEQLPNCKSEHDRIVLVMGYPQTWTKSLREICERAFNSRDTQEWAKVSQKLSVEQRKLLDSIRKLLGKAQVLDLLELMSRIDVRDIDADRVRRDLSIYYMPECEIKPLDLFDKLFKIVMDAAEKGKSIDQTWVTQRLANEKIQIKPLSQSHQGRKNRDILLGKIDLFNRTILENYLRGTDPLTLSMIYRNEAVTLPGDDVMQTNPYNYSPDLTGKQIPEIFDQALGKLLILGEPGSGKTTMLLQLASCLINKAKTENNQPIPVILNLSAWEKRTKLLSEWLVSQLYDLYQVPKEIAQTLIQDDQLLYLFDGLDEVNEEIRSSCVDAINEFLLDHEIKIAVCCRTTEYMNLKAKLRFNNAVSIQKLDIRQVDELLARHGDRADAAKDIIQHDPILLELASSPLMLTIMTLVFNDTFKDIPVPSETIEQRRESLLSAYVNNAFYRKKSKFTKETTIKILSWLAKQMVKNGQSTFLVEKMQPSWLDTVTQQKAFSSIVGVTLGILAGIIFGLAVTFASSPIFGIEFGRSIGFAFSFAWGIGVYFYIRAKFDRLSISIFGIAVSLAWGLAGWLALGLMAAIGFGIFGLLLGLVGYGFILKKFQNRSANSPLEISPVDILRLSWTRAKTSLLTWLLFGSMIGLGIGVPVAFASNLSNGIVYGIATALSFVLTFGIAGGLTTGEVEKNIEPNQGIRRAFRNSMILGGSFGTIMFIVYSLMFGPFFGWVSGILTGVSVGLAGWFVGWILFGGLTYVQHYVLRFILVLNHRIPWNFVAFLEDSANLSLLVKYGGGYVFFHRLLLDYFSRIE